MSTNHAQDIETYVQWLEDTGRLTHEEKETVLRLVTRFVADELVMMNQQGC